MTAILAKAPRRGAPPHHRITTLTGLFWAFSYVLLSIRGALFFDDWTRLIDDNRLLTVTVGAGAFAIVLKQLEGRRSIKLGEVTTWIVAATLAVLIVRMTIDQMAFDVPQGMGVNLLYGLSWAAYFGLWVIGSLAFAPAAARTVSVVQPIAAATVETPAKRDDLEALIVALLEEAGALRPADRKSLAERVLAAGGYESADADPRDNERARLAVRIAARLADRA